MSQRDLFPAAPRAAPPPRQEKPAPQPYVPDLAAARERDRRILAALRTPGTLADILRRANAGPLPPLTQSATVADLTFLVNAGDVVQEPLYSLPKDPPCTR